MRFAFNSVWLHSGCCGVALIAPSLGVAICYLFKIASRLALDFGIFSFPYYWLLGIYFYLDFLLVVNYPDTTIYLLIYK